jgi:transposase
MAGQRKSYTPEFKREAVRLITEGGLSPSRVARDLDVDRSLLGKWKQQFEVGAQSGDGYKAFPGHGNQHNEELAQLRRENEILRQEREVLKKAVSIFAPQLR